MSAACSDVMNAWEVKLAPVTDAICADCAVSASCRSCGSADADTNDDKDFAGRLFFDPFRPAEISSLANLGIGIGASYGKQTGTTNAHRDAWFVAFTGNLVAGVWAGNDDYQSMQRMTGGSLPAQTARANDSDTPMAARRVATTAEVARATQTALQQPAQRGAGIGEAPGLQLAVGFRDGRR